MIRKLLIALLALIATAVLAYLGNRIYQQSVARRDVAERAASPQGPLPESVQPLSYDLRLRIDPTGDSFSGKSRIAIRIHEPVDVIWLHGKDLRAAKTILRTADGRELPLDYHEMGHSGVVRLAAGEAVAAQDAMVEIDFSADFNTRLEGLYKAAGGDQVWAFTQFAPLAARNAFPAFDEPRFKVPFDVTLEVRETHAAVANTPVVSEQRLDDGFKRLRFATSKPLPTYLVAFAAGDLEIVEWQPLPPNEVRSEPVPLRGVARKGKGGEMAFALRHTAPMVEALERYFASPYPYRKLDLVAVPEFLFNGMENAALITYQEGYLLLGDDPAVPSIRAYADIHAHELAHQWHGNLVTMPWWDDVWLNEAFATWLGTKIADAWDPSLELGRSTVSSAHAVMDSDSYLSARRLREPIASNHDIVNAFDDITYLKGAGVLHMFESFLGEEAFREGVRLHLRRFRFGHARAEDFVESLMQAAGRAGIDTAFFSFLERPGVPLVRVGWQCGAEGVRVDLQQSRYLPVGSEGSSEQTWQIPACMRLAGGGTSTKHCTLLEEQEEVVELEAEGCPAVVVPNAGAAGYYRWSLPEDRWRSLLDHLDLLTTAEKLSAIDNLAAELRAGRIGVDFFLEAVVPYAGMEEWDLVVAPLWELGFIVDYLADGDTRETLRGYLNHLYLPVLERVGWEGSPGDAGSEPPSRPLLRERLVRFLAYTTRSPEVRRRLLDLGRAYLGYQADGQLHPELVGDDLVETALGVALQTLGRPYFEALLKRFEASEDLVFRQRALLAMGRVTDPELGEEIRGRVRSFSLSFGEKGILFRGLLAERANQQALFERLKKGWDIASLLLPESVLAQLSSVAIGFCTEEQYDAAKEFFEPRLAEVTGGPRILRNRLERIEICIARVNQQSDFRVP